jgi:DME family drug/metabolite transporter
MSGVLMALGAASLWATLGLFGKLLYREGFSPVQLAMVRAVGGFLWLAVVMAPRWRLLRVARRDLMFLVLYGIGGFAFFEALYFVSIQRSTVAVAAALLYTAPAFVVLITSISLRSPPPRSDLLPLALVLAGVFLVTGAAGALGSISTSALLIGLASGLTYGTFTLFSKRSLDRFPPVVTAFYGLGVASVVLLPLAPPWRLPVHDARIALTLVALGIVPTLLPFLLFLGALRHLPSSAVSMLASIEPVIAALLGVFFLGEMLRVDRIAGIALIVCAALLIAWRGRREEAEVLPGAH